MMGLEELCSVSKASIDLFVKPVDSSIDTIEPMVDIFDGVRHFQEHRWTKSMALQAE